MPDGSPRAPRLTVTSLSRLFGDEFLPYLLNTTAEGVTDIAVDNVSATEREALTLRGLRRIARDVLSRETTWFRRKILYEKVTRYVGSRQTTWANGMRLANGGSLPPIEGRDEFERQFCHLLRDAYPALLIHWAVRATDTSPLHGIMAQHPVRRSFVQMAESSELDRVCSTPAHRHAERWSTGHHVEYPVEEAFDLLLSGTVDALNLRGGARGWPELLECGQYVLDQTRAANRRGRCQAAVIAGIGDVRLTGQDSAVLMSRGHRLTPGKDPEPPFLVLSTPTSEVLPPPLDTSHILERGVMAQIYWHEEVRWTEAAPDDVDSNGPTQNSAEVLQRRSRQQLLDIARLALASVESDWEPRVPALMAQRLLLPFGERGTSEILPELRVDLFTEAPGRPPGSNHRRWLVVRAAEAQQIAETCHDLVNGVATPSMVTAVRRLASARGRRDAAPDQLVDCVLAVEAMFGGTEKPGSGPGAAKIKQALCAAANGGTALADDLVVASELFHCRNRVVHGGGRGDDGDSVALEEQIASILPKAFDLVGRALLQISRDPRFHSCTTSYERRSAALDG